MAIEVIHGTLGSQGANCISCTPVIAKTSSSDSETIPDFKVFRSVDTLEVSLWLDWFHPEFMSMLDEKRVECKELDVPSLLADFDNEQWSILRSAPGYYRSLIKTGDISILLSSHKSDGQIANCKIEIGSLSCWSGVFQLVKKLKKMLTTHGCSIKKEMIGRVDLCADFVGVDIRDTNVKNEDFWITKARQCCVYSTDRKFNAITYGRGDMALRIYDKVLELKLKRATQKQEEFSKIWGEEDYESKPVTRVEYQIRRAVLKSFGDERRNIQTCEDLEKYISSLWKYCVKQWARHTLTLVDRDNNHQQRSLPSKFWFSVLKVTWGGYGRLKRSVSPIRKNIKALREQMRGIALTLASSTGLHRTDFFSILDVTKRMLIDDLASYMTEKETEFYHKYNQRQVECMTAVNY